MMQRIWCQLAGHDDVVGLVSVWCQHCGQPAPPWAQRQTPMAHVADLMNMIVEPMAAAFAEVGVALSRAAEALATAIMELPWEDDDDR